MSFPTLHPENKAINLLDSAVTLVPQLRQELKEWVRELSGTIARPVPVPEALQDLEQPGDGNDIDLERETYLLAQALCTYRERVYPDGVAAPHDPRGDARDDLESAMNRFEERLARSKPKVELENEPDAGDYYQGDETEDRPQ